MQVSILKHEKEILVNSEKRAIEEVRNLSDKVHRLQVTNYEFVSLIVFNFLYSTLYFVQFNLISIVVNCSQLLTLFRPLGRFVRYVISMHLSFNSFIV